MSDFGIAVVKAIQSITGQLNEQTRYISHLEQQNRQLSNSQQEISKKLKGHQQAIEQHQQNFEYYDQVNNESERFTKNEQQREALKEKDPYFKHYESEVNEYLESNPDCDVESIYDYVKEQHSGEINQLKESDRRIDELSKAFGTNPEEVKAHVYNALIRDTKSNNDELSCAFGLDTEEVESYDNPKPANSELRKAFGLSEVTEND